MRPFVISLLSALSLSPAFLVFTGNLSGPLCPISLHLWMVNATRQMTLSPLHLDQGRHAPYISINQLVLLALFWIVVEAITGMATHHMGQKPSRDYPAHFTFGVVSFIPSHWFPYTEIGPTNTVVRCATKQWRATWHNYTLSTRLWKPKIAGCELGVNCSL